MKINNDLLETIERFGRTVRLATSNEVRRLTVQRRIFWLDGHPQVISNRDGFLETTATLEKLLQQAEARVPSPSLPAAPSPSAPPPLPEPTHREPEVPSPEIRAEDAGDSGTLPGNPEPQQHAESEAEDGDDREGIEPPIKAEEAVLRGPRPSRTIEVRPGVDQRVADTAMLAIMVIRAMDVPIAEVPQLIEALHARSF